MELINENITEEIAMLKELLVNCIDEENIVCIHGKVCGYTIRYSSILNEFNVDYNKLYLVCGWCEVHIEENIVEITYNNEENSVHIVSEKGELYIDFNIDE